MPKTAFQILKEASPTVSVGVMTANLLSLGEEVKLLEQTDVKLLHFDVMDGCFCPMMTVGPPFIKAVKTPLLKDVHLMIDEPLDKLADYVAAGADMIVIHVESNSYPHRALQTLDKMTNTNDPERGIIKGIAINPGTPVETILPLLGLVDVIMLLAINPGWGGQPFDESTAGRIAAVKEMIAKSGRDILVGVDGGVTKNNITDVAAMGVDFAVTGSAVYDGKDPVGNARFMLGAIKG